MSLPRLYVLRHGETEWNRQGRMQGALDSPLTETGRAQALRQAEILSRLDNSTFSWITSPQGRTRQTADIIANHCRVTFAENARLREIDMGAWTGRNRDEIAKERPDLKGLAIYLGAPGGETIEAVAVRLRALLGDLNKPTVIITHGLTSRILRCLATHGDVSRFDEIGGGQGVVYEIHNQEQNLLE